MALKPMDPRIILKLLEGHEDVITPLARERQKFYDSKTCTECGSPALVKTWDADTVFRDNDLLPRAFLKCESCDALMDPHSGILLSLGNQGKAMEPVVPIIDPES